MTFGAVTRGRPPSALRRRLLAAGVAGACAFAVAGCEGDSGSQSPTAPAPSPTPSAPVEPPVPTRCAEEGRVLEFGFYALYEPISYGASGDPEAAGFNEHRGYEADLLTALEAMEGTGLAFNRRGIDTWPGMWLLPATSELDLVGGGIKILEERTRDAAGTPAVAFTSGHIGFRLALLVRALDAAGPFEYSDLTKDVAVGVSAETTAESRLLRIVGLTDENGVLLAGTSVTTPTGAVVADGSDAYRIAATEASENLSGREHLDPPSTGFPQVVFFDSESVRSERLLALVSGRVDALAGDEIGHRAVEQAAGGHFAVTALDAHVELGGFALAEGDPALLACLDDKLNYLTDDRNIGYSEWLANPAVFLERAEAWTP